MNYLLITIFVTLNVCYGQSTDSSVSGDIIIDNKTVTIPAVTVISTTSDTTTKLPTTKPSNATTTITPKTSTSNPTTSTATTNSTPTTSTAKPTVFPTVSSTTEEPPTKSPVTTVAPTPSNTRKFDGPSFVGGIVLASGLMAIGFVAFKFYRARSEQNYHTL